MNDAMITCEPIPVAKGPWDTVIGTALNKTGALVIRAEKTVAAEATAEDEILRLVAGLLSSSITLLLEPAKSGLKGVFHERSLCHRPRASRD